MKEIHSTNYKEVISYCNDIKTGKILSGVFTKKAINRFLDDIKKSKESGYPFYLDIDKADLVIDFAESLKIPDMPTADKKLKLLSWHKFIYYNLFGWCYKDNPERRRFRQAYIEVARKNSKTTSLLFPIILYDFLTSEKAESYLVSKDGDQAEKSFKELVEIIKADPDLDSACKETVSTITTAGSRISFFSSDSSGIDSYKNSLSVIDEFHAYDSDKIITAFRYGGRARLNNLVLIITSAGLDVSKPCYAENQKAQKILNGILTDESYFSIIYAYDEKDDWKDPNNFIKANPSLNTILKKEILLSDLQDALITPSHQSDFISKTCGIWSRRC
jgi:phage terminase large subunit-like protein